MKIIQENKNDVVICKIDGEINISTSSELRKFFDNLVQNKTKKIILDFNSLSYIDSSGLATLIELLQRIKKIDGKFYICNMSDKIKNIFEITKLHKLFEVFENQELALNKF